MAVSATISKYAPTENCSEVHPTGDGVAVPVVELFVLGMFEPVLV